MATWSRVDVARSGVPVGLALVFSTSCLLNAGCAEPAKAPQRFVRAQAAEKAPAAPAVDGTGGGEFHRFPTAPGHRLSGGAAAILPRPHKAGTPTAKPAQLATAQPGRSSLPSPAGGLPVVVRAPRPFRVSSLGAAKPATPRLLAVTGGRALAEATPSAVPHRPAAEQSPRGDEADGTLAREEIAAMLRGYLADFNRHDARALASHWSDGAESIDLASGEATQGRGEVEEVFAALFRADAEATFDLDIESIRLVGSDVAVVDAVSHMAFSPDAGQSGARSRLSAVLARHRNQWLIESVRESPLAPSAAPQRVLDSLDWLVGEWEDAGDGVTAHTRCFWSTGRAFLIRCHTASSDPAGEAPIAAVADRIPDLLPPGSAGTREITEIIGWDPKGDTIRSWVFTSEGHFAEGTWTRRGDRWLVRMEGAGANEGAACIATLERIGTDELAFRCTGDTLADALPPACDFSRIER